KRLTDNNYLESASSAAAATTINKASIALGLTANPNPVQVSDHVTLTPTASSVLGSATGTFRLAFGATDPIATGIVPGSGYSYTIPNSTVPGPYTVTAYSTGDPNFQDGSASVSVTVT